MRRPAPIRRWTIRVALCLLAGAVLQTLTTWYIALNPRGLWLSLPDAWMSMDSEYYRDDRMPVRVGVRVRDSVVSSEAEAYTYTRPLPPPDAPIPISGRYAGPPRTPDHTSVESVPGWVGVPRGDARWSITWYARIVFAFGWPMRSLSYEYSSEDPAEIGIIAVPAGLRDSLSDAGVSISEHLPAKLIWTGLLANSVLFALPLLVPFVFVQATIRGSRRLRNRCPACGYSLAGLDTERCPECGRAIALATPPRRTREAEGRTGL